MQVKLRLEYDGTNYSGWQWQSRQDSVQARIEAALKRIFSEQVRVRGAGRTDAGAHATGQVAAARLPRPFACPDLLRALNALLPPDVVVTDAVEVADSFEPRRQARSRLYEYRVLNRQLRSAFEYRHCWLVREPLAFEALEAAARFFVGEHDFRAFRKLGSGEKTTVRRVLSSAWTKSGERLAYRVEASAFLRGMVRAMVATMVDVGRGKLAPEVVAELLGGKRARRAAAAAPACGLFLVDVRY